MASTAHHPAIPSWSPSRLPTRLAALALGALLAGCGRGDTPTVDVQGPSRTADTEGPYLVTVVIRDEAPVKSAAVRWFTQEAATPAPLSLKQEPGSGRWTAELPGQPAGTTVRYRVEVEDDEGRLLVSPAQGKAGEAPKAYSFDVIDPNAATP